MVVRATVDRTCGCEGPVLTAVMPAAAYSDVSLLSSPALRTLFGRLPRCAGDAAPPVVVDPGRLSPTRLLIRDSISRRLSARPGVGAISCYSVSTLQPSKRTCHHPVRTSGPILCRDADACVLNSRCRFSSASFAFFARISSRRCCMAVICVVGVPTSPTSAACSWQHGLLRSQISGVECPGFPCSVLGFRGSSAIKSSSGVHQDVIRGRVSVVNLGAYFKMVDAFGIKYVLQNQIVVSVAFVRSWW